ncbi:hypothetical protein FGE12_00820 [Aggregicoccus sp. 17bor-14]|nr:hypothetical protein [Aggregicoccus sp. 17bor-14]
MSHPAFISRIEEAAGPRSDVFREDDTYEPTLRRLDPKEADRRLAVKLGQTMSRFELSERLRVTTLSRLPAEAPWTHALDPARVASALDSFLVEEVPANAPDYELLRPLGADAVVELVIQEYGMHSEDGHAGAYVQGYGRLFELKGGAELWRRTFRADQRDKGGAALDPYRVAKQPELFRDALTALLDGVAAELAQGLTPKDHAARPPTPAPAAPAQPAPAPSPALPPGELPEPAPETAPPEPPVEAPGDATPEPPASNPRVREPGTLP